MQVRTGVAPKPVKKPTDKMWVAGVRYNNSWVAVNNFVKDVYPLCYVSVYWCIVPVLYPAVPVLYPAVPVLHPAVPVLYPAVPVLYPAVPVLYPNC